MRSKRIWLRVRKRLSSAAAGSQRSESSVACGFGGIRGDALQPAQSLEREGADLLREFRGCRRQPIVVRRVHAHHPRRLGGAGGGLDLGSEHHRHLAEDLPGLSRADDPLLAVDELGQFDPAGDHHEEGARVALVHEELALGKLNVRPCSTEPVKLRLRHAGENLEGRDLFDSQHSTLHRDSAPLYTARSGPGGDFASSTPGRERRSGSRCMTL